MKKYYVLSLTTLICMFTSVAQAALIPNGSFENGLNDWAVSNHDLVYLTHSHIASDGTPVPNVPISATHGNSFAVIGSNDPVSWLRSDLLSVKEGDFLTFDWLFDTWEISPPWNDFFRFLLSTTQGDVLVDTILADVPASGPFGLIEGQFGFQMPVDAVVNLEFQAGNVAGNSVPSFGIVDNIRLDPYTDPAKVPLPGTIPLIVAGLSGLWFVRKPRGGRNARTS